LLILPDEEAFYRDLRAKDDRKEFERIFWARRDPDPRTPENELRQAVELVHKRADELFSGGLLAGSLTGCGQVLALLGEPLEREGRETRTKFESAPFMKEGALKPETWTYRDRRGETATFTGGELRIAFDEACQFAEGGRVLEDLRRVAESRVVRPEIAYRRTAEGRLVPLEQLSSSAGGGKTLLESGRADFPIAVEATLLLRTKSGEAYAAGLLRAELGDGAPATPGQILVGAVDEAGKVGSVVERGVWPAVSQDGASLASWGLTLQPGQRALRVGYQVGDRAAVAPLSVEVPDYEAPGLKTSSLVLFPAAPAAGPAGAQDAYAALSVGALQVKPRFGNRLHKADEVQVVCVIYGGAIDPATGRAALRARFSFLKDGGPVAKGEEQAFETPMAVASVGPIPLAGFEVGAYLVRLEIEDAVAKVSRQIETPFTIVE
jgi:GWxTD domain-containing protein